VSGLVHRTPPERAVDAVVVSRIQRIRWKDTSAMSARWNSLGGCLSWGRSCSTRGSRPTCVGETWKVPTRLQIVTPSLDVS
jgi:hypothetical protein